MTGPVYRYRATVVRVIDADTLALRVDLGFRCSVELEGRVRGIDAPENETHEGRRAEEWAHRVLYSGSGDGDVIIESFRDRRSFARWVVDVWLLDGTSYADALVAAGHAVRV